MPLPNSSLYLACQGVINALSTGIQANSNNINLYMGAPADISSKDDEIRLNLFFYRFEPSGFQAGVHPNEPWRIRMFCMMTCMGADGDDQGEEDIRLMGMVMSYLHENKIFPTVVVGTESIRLQAIFSPASDEQINQIWSTQGDTTYRPSVLYEIALAPVMPETIRGEAPKVGFTGLESTANIQNRYTTFSGNAAGPEVENTSVSQSNPAWVPVLCWVEGDECKTTLSLDVELTDPTAFTPTVWVAGQANANIDFEWQVWERGDWSSEAGSNLLISSTEITPDNIPIGLPAVALPSLTITGEDRWQVILYATRSYQPYAGAPSVVLRSNPVLISLYRGSTL